MTEPASPIRRFSSRRQKLALSFLAQRLHGAKAYDRIAGCFCASIVETAREALHAVERPVHVVCNCGLQTQGASMARAAAASLHREM